MGLFGLFGKKGTRIDAETVVKLMSAAPLDFEDVKQTDEGYPVNLFECGNIANTVKGLSQVLRLYPCRDKVSLVRARVKKHQITAFYVTPAKFQLTFGWRNGGRVKMEAKLKTDAASSLAEWLQANVKTPGENVTAAGFGKLLDGQFCSDKPPDWLEISEREDIAEVKPPDPPKELSVEDLKPGVKVFDYLLIERELGSGGQGKVFLATNTQTLVEQHRKVVLKVLRCENCGDEASMQEFIKEANTLADFSDPRIVTCYWCRPLGKVPILAMEYVEGDSLEKYLANQLANQEDGRLGEEETRELLRPIAEALDSAHERGVYHRDVKPQNIIVRKTPRRIGKQTFRTCLLDFGIASRGQVDDCQTSFKSTRGTLQYMSPEQLRGNSNPSAGMDVYSLAVTAYECLTGTLPYLKGWEPDVTVAPIASDTPFAKAVMRGLSERSKDRPATCVELIDPPSPQQDPVTPDDDSQEPPRSPPDDLVELKKPFEVYRALLAQSAQRSAGNPDLAEWLRTCQANLRNLTQNLAYADASALILLFKGVRQRMGSARPDDFFAATDRLVELRFSLPKSGGAVWRALCDSVK